MQRCSKWCPTEVLTDEYDLFSTNLSSSAGTWAQSQCRIYSSPNHYIVFSLIPFFPISVHPDSPSTLTGRLFCPLFRETFSGLSRVSCQPSALHLVFSSSKLSLALNGMYIPVHIQLSQGLDHSELIVHLLMNSKANKAGPVCKAEWKTEAWEKKNPELHCLQKKASISTCQFSYVRRKALGTFLCSLWLIIICTTEGDS